MNDKKIEPINIESFKIDNIYLKYIQNIDDGSLKYIRDIENNFNNCIEEIEKSSAKRHLENLKFYENKITEYYTISNLDMCLYISDRLLNLLEKYKDNGSIDYYTLANRYRNNSINKIEKYLSLGNNIIYRYYHNKYMVKDTVFKDNEILIIKGMGFDNFNGENVNIKNTENGNSIIMSVCSILGLQPENEELINILSKLIDNYDTDLNILNNNFSTLLSNLILLGQNHIINFIANCRGDIDLNKFKSGYGDTYIDLANGCENYSIANFINELIIKEKEKEIFILPKKIINIKDKENQITTINDTKKNCEIVEVTNDTINYKVLYEEKINKISELELLIQKYKDEKTKTKANEESINENDRPKMINKLFDDGLKNKSNNDDLNDNNFVYYRIDNIYIIGIGVLLFIAIIMAIIMLSIANN